MNAHCMKAAAAVMFVAATGLFAQDTRPAPKSEAADPAALIGRLENESYDVRSKAMADLRALGEAARPALEASRDATGLETRTRVRELLSELDAAKARPAPGAGGERLRPDESSEDVDPRSQLRGRREQLHPFDPFGPFPPVGPFRDMDAWRKSLDDMNRLHEEMERLMRGGVGERFDVAGPGTSFRFELGPGGSTLRTRSVTTAEGLHAELTESDAGVVLKLREGDVTSVYKAADLETLKAQQPELVERLKGVGILDGGSTRVFRGGVDAPKAESRGTAARKLEPIDGTPAPPLPLPPPRPFARALGVMVAAPPAILDKHLKLGGSGVVVLEVIPGGEASQAGVLVDDVVTHVGGEAVASGADLKRALSAREGTVKIRVVREGAAREIEVSPVEGR